MHGLGTWHSTPTAARTIEKRLLQCGKEEMAKNEFPLAGHARCQQVPTGANYDSHEIGDTGAVFQQAAK